MIINGFVFKNPLRIKGFLTFSLFISFFFFNTFSFGQTAEAEKNFAVCKACHTIGGGKLIGPNLEGVSERRDEPWLIKFIQNSQEMIAAGDPIAVQVFEEHNKIPMPPNALSDDQVRDLLLYIENGGVLPEGVVGEGVVPDGTTEAQLEQEDSTQEFLTEMHQNDARHLQTTFIAMIVLIVISLFDLFVTKLVKQRWIHTVIILISLVISGEVLFVEATNLGRQQYYQPEQPVWFSHKIHAEQNKIDCKYCHFTVDRSMHAGIPPTSVCLNCHNQVKTGKVTGETEIAKIFESVNSGKPIEWVKVHNLPDHVYFNHAQHVNAGKVDCNQCHGQVEKMDEVIQVEDLSMGWCIDCHRSTEINMDNKFYDQYIDLHDQLSSGDLKRVTVDLIGGEDCQKCHY